MAGQVLSKIPRPRARHWGLGLAALIIVVAVFVAALSAKLESGLTVPLQIAMIFAPTFIAIARSHRNTTAIFVFNLLIFSGLMYATEDPFLFILPFMVQ